MGDTLIPELAVSDWRASRRFYCDVLGFDCAHDRPEEGFSFLRLGDAALMIDQIGLGRTFDAGHAPHTHPFGRGLNLQIRVPSVAPLLDALDRDGHAPVLPLEDRWYRIGARMQGHRQFVVADPDGYLLRFFEDLGSSPSATS